MFDIPLEKVMAELREDMSPLMNNTQAISEFLFLNAHIEPHDQDILDAIEHLSVETGITLHPDNARKILSLYPHANIKLAVYGDDTETQGLVMDAFAHFFLGCRWPMNGDLPGIDVVEFSEAMFNRAVKMKFVAIPENHNG